MTLCGVVVSCCAWLSEFGPVWGQTERVEQDYHVVHVTHVTPGALYLYLPHTLSLLRDRAVQWGEGTGEGSSLGTGEWNRIIM